MSRSLCHALLILLWCAALPLPVHAETKVLTAEATYTMGEGETMTFAEAMALQKAKQIALEQAGTYVESYAKVQNYQLTAEEIQTIAGGVLQVEVLEKTRTLVGDGLKHSVKIKATVTTDKILDLTQRIKGKNVAEEYKKLQEEYARLTREIETWKQLIAKTPAGPERDAALDQIRERERTFTATQRNEESFFQRLLAGDVLVREAMDTKTQLDRLFEAAILQGYTIELGQAKSSIMAGSANLKIIVPITLQAAKHLRLSFNQVAQKLGGDTRMHSDEVTMIRVASDVDAVDYFLDKVRNTAIAVVFELANGMARSCSIRNFDGLEGTYLGDSPSGEVIHRIYPAYLGDDTFFSPRLLHYSKHRSEKNFLVFDSSAVSFYVVVILSKEHVQDLKKVSANIFRREQNPELIKNPCGIKTR